MMLSVSVWDLQAKSVDQQFAFVLLGSSRYSYGPYGLFALDLTYSLYLYLYRKALSYSCLLLK